MADMQGAALLDAWWAFVAALTERLNGAGDGSLVVRVVFDVQHTSSNSADGVAHVTTRVGDRIVDERVACNERDCLVQTTLSVGERTIATNRASFPNAQRRACAIAEQCLRECGGAAAPPPLDAARIAALHIEVLGVPPDDVSEALAYAIFVEMSDEDALRIARQLSHSAVCAHLVLPRPPVGCEPARLQLSMALVFVPVMPPVPALQLPWRRAPPPA